MSRRQIDGRLARGLLHPVHRAVYVGQARLTSRGRWLAAVLACGPSSLLSHRSAAALHGLLRARGSSDVTTSKTRRRGSPGIRVHRTRNLHHTDRATVDGIPVTSVARTLLDLADAVDERSLRRAFEEADRLRLLSLRVLEEARARAHGRHGLAVFDRTLARHRVPPDVRSELERRFLELCEQAGVPQPSLNVLVAGHLVDCLWAQQRLVVELDGFAYHRTRAAHERDHERDVDLGLAGYRVLRFTWAQLRDQPDKVMAAVRRGLASPARRRGA